MIGVLAVPQVAGARPWTAEYDWQASSRTGYENWVAEESVPGSGQPLPFYRTYLGGAPAQIGRGLAIAPLGGRVYDNGDPASQTGGPGLIFRWAVPGASRITTARFDDVRYRNANDGQYLRLRLAGPGGHQDADLGPDFDEEDANTTYSRGPYTQTVPGGGTSAELWMFTVCGSAPQGEPGPFRCPTIAAGTPTFGRLGSARLTLDDPDQPALAVDASPAIDDGWVNKRRTQRLQITAADPSSGIQRIRVQVRSGTASTGGRTLKTQTVACDPDHTTPGRAGLVCPVTAGTSAVDPAGNQTGSDRSYVVTATDYAGNERSQSFTVRRDTQAPTGGSVSGGELRKLTDGWTNREGTVPVRLRGQDSRSGVARLQLFARRVASGRATELADAAVTCTGSCREASEVTNATLDRQTLPRDGRYRLEVRVTDRAGNVKTFGTGRLIKVDREAPTGMTGYISRRRDGWYAMLRPGRDHAESSGPGAYAVTYPVGGGGRATVRAAVGKGPTLRTTSGHYRVVRLPGYVVGRSGESTVAVQLDAAGNAGRQAVLRNAAVAALMVGSPQVAAVVVAIGVGTIAGVEVARAVANGIRVIEYERTTITGCTGACDTASAKTKTALRRVRTARSVAASFFRNQTSSGLERRAVARLNAAIAASKAALGAALHDGYAGDPDARPLRGQQELVDELTRLVKVLRAERTRVAEAHKTATARARDARCRAYSTPRRGGLAYVVYRGYSAGQVVYVGITRQSLRRRCQAHLRDNRGFAGDIRQLKLRRALSRDEARAVEQTLINHYGRRDRARSVNLDTGRTGPAGPLVNVINSVSPRRRTKYCEAIDLGHRRVRDFGPGGVAGPYNAFRAPRAPLRTCG